MTTSVLERETLHRNVVHRPLLVSVGIMATGALVCVLGLIFDGRTMLGESVWLKPLKFTLAFVMYSSTLAWLLSLPHKGSRWTWWFGTLFAITGVVDVGFIFVQAARGTFSHFNTAADPVNSIGQVIFASGVPGLFFANLCIAGMLLFQRVGDRPLATAIRWGMGISVVGMGLGYLMGARGAHQFVRDANGDVVELAARHSVGVVDGGPGLPITHWSTVGGDLRVAHFAGLHGLLFLLLLTVVLGRYGIGERRSAWIVGMVGAGYLATVVLLTWQALRAQSVVHPDAKTLFAGGAVALLTGAGLWIGRISGVRERAAAVMRCSTRPTTMRGMPDGRSRTSRQPARSGELRDRPRP